MKKFLCVLVFGLTILEVSASEIYLLKTVIAGKVFDDLLIIEARAPQLKGSLTVPGAFSVPLINGKYEIRWAGDFYKFTIKALEDGKELIVHYQLHMEASSTESIKGVLLMEDGSKLGEVIGGGILKIEDILP